MIPYIIGGVFILLVFWFIGIYNKFMSTKKNYEASIRDLGNAFKDQIRRLSKLDTLSVKYRDHESSIHKTIASFRSNIQKLDEGKVDTKNLEELSKQSGQIASAINVSFENYPELKASEDAKMLKEQVINTDDRIYFIGNTINDLANVYNTMMVTIPSNLVAILIGIKEELKGIETPERGEHTTTSKEELSGYQMK